MAMIVIPTTKATSAMAIIQSSIELADRTQKRIFVASIVFGVVGALIAASLAWLVWKANNKYQDAVKADADARIAEAGTKAAVANAEAAKANEGLAKSNEEIARLTKEAEQAKTERAEADKQIAIAKADAAKATEGTAKATAEVARLQAVVANAERKRAEAERALLELQERIKPRKLSAKQSADFVAALRATPKGVIDLGYTSSGCDDCFDFTRQFFGLFKEAGWTIRNEASFFNHFDIQVVGVAALVRGPAPSHPGLPPPPGEIKLTPTLEAIRAAFKAIGTDVEFVNMGPDRDATIPEIVIGLKPRP